MDSFPGGYMSMYLSIVTAAFLSAGVAVATKCKSHKATWK